MDRKKLEQIIEVVQDPNEKKLLRRILDLSYRAQKTYSIAYTDFIDPFLLGKIKSYKLELLGFNFLCYGGLDNSERQMIAFAHEDIEIRLGEFPIEYIKIAVGRGIGKPVSHRDYLGAMMGLGIEREKIGDLIIKDNDCYVMAHQDIAEYILHTLDSVSRYGKVTCTSISKEDIPNFEQEFKSLNVTVSSPRADAIIAAGFQLSRSTVAKLIGAQRALCNGIIITQSTPIKENDVCTLRGYGKIRIKEIGSTTRKGRIRVNIHRYI